jgi:hypothetical protein
LEHSSDESDLIVIEKAHLCFYDVAHFLIDFFISVDLLRLVFIKVRELNVLDSIKVRHLILGS